MTDISLRADVLLKGQKGMKKGNKQFKFFYCFPIYQFYKEKVNSWQASNRQMFRVSPKTKNVLCILAIDSLLQFLIWLKITNFCHVLLNAIFQRECHFADRQITSKSIQVYRSGPLVICSFNRNIKKNHKLTNFFIHKIFISQMDTLYEVD